VNQVASGETNNNKKYNSNKHDKPGKQEGEGVGTGSNTARRYLTMAQRLEEQQLEVLAKGYSKEHSAEVAVRLLVGPMGRWRSEQEVHSTVLGQGVRHSMVQALPGPARDHWR
jgi:hypothetical protein